MKKTILLNGRTFEVRKSKYACVENLKRYANRWLYDCYANPTPSKKAIFKEWAEWAWVNDVEYFGVSSYNKFQFSLQGLVKHEGEYYILNITSAHNIAYIVE